MNGKDPFSGTWTFSSKRSRWAGQPPRRWIQTIRVEGLEIAVREEIDFGVDPQPAVLIQARLDGELYPVTGSPAADHVSYQRKGERALTGTAYKGGTVCLREELTVTPARDELRMEYTLHVGTREVSGVAVFLRSKRKPVAGNTL